MLRAAQVRKVLSLEFVRTLVWYHAWRRSLDPRQELTLCRVRDFGRDIRREDTGRKGFDEEVL
jgi:hypothetical protein